MTYTFISARFANADHTSAIAMTAEAAEIALSPIDTPDDWADLLAWGTPEPFTTGDLPYNLYRSVFIRRMSEQEVQTMEAVLQNPATPAKLRMMFYAVDYFVSDDPLFVQLNGAVAAALGQPRADELLAAE
ncbi:hypothetical protein [Paradevosia shaoguanensis]|uniref:hypothetical protein n=1 Tax=Paradevosia shaoguanensis TaxID=1335043 RepID=UPI001931535E|nr:hypothetical protein [Paradevosia shaoguanensis]